MIRYFLKLLLLLTLPVSSYAQDTSRLERFLDGLTTYSAQFEQIVMDGDRIEIERSLGELLLRRAEGRHGQFRWTYTEPYPQLIVSDGEVLWLYDEDLEQVTVKPIDESMRRTPAMVLTSSEKLENNFEVIELGKRGTDSYEWLELKAKSASGDEADQQYDAIWLGFEGDELRAMEMVDGFGQTTKMIFSQAQRNPDIEAARFTFVIPDGVDVVTQKELPES